MNKDKDFILQLQAGQCVSCGICAESCAYGAIRMGDFPEVDEENCRLCGGCVQACPVGAWVMQRQDERQEQPVDDSNGIWVWAEVMDGFGTGKPGTFGKGCGTCGLPSPTGRGCTDRR